MIFLVNYRQINVILSVVYFFKQKLNSVSVINKLHSLQKNYWKITEISQIDDILHGMFIYIISISITDNIKIFFSKKHNNI